jgi:hypothetical protein
MDSGAMIYIPSFIKIDSGIQKLRVGFMDTDSMRLYLAYFYFFKIWKVCQQTPAEKKNHVKWELNVAEWKENR